MNALTSVLEHAPYDFPSEDVGKEARQYLGYGVADFEKWLRDSEIHWFTPESVNTYMREKRKEEERKKKKELRKQLGWMPLPILNSEYSMRWVRRPLCKDADHASRFQRYTEPIPEDALKLAIAAKKKFKDQCHLYVMSLELEYSDKYVADPFLVAEVNGAEYYLAVWDEPSYKAEVIR